jgi:hypothetical protein
MSYCTGMCGLWKLDNKALRVEYILSSKALVAFLDPRKAKSLIYLLPWLSR